MRSCLLLLLVGCGLTENSFRNEQARLTCERKEECPDAASGADCNGVDAPPQSELFDCRFDNEQAQACLDAIPQAACEGSGIAFAPSCGQVFVDCEAI